MPIGQCALMIYLISSWSRSQATKTDRMEQPTWARMKKMPAYCQFNDIVYRKLRLIGLCLGLHILQREFRPSFWTAITTHYSCCDISAIAVFHNIAICGWRLQAQPFAQDSRWIFLVVLSVFIKTKKPHSTPRWPSGVFFCCWHVANSSN